MSLIHCWSEFRSGKHSRKPRCVFYDGSVEQCSGEVFTQINADDRSQSESQSVASEPACAGRLVSDQSVAGKLPRYNCVTVTVMRTNADI